MDKRRLGLHLVFFIEYPIVKLYQNYVDFTLDVSYNWIMIWKENWIWEKK